MKKEYINLLTEKKVKQIEKISKKDLARCSCDHRKENGKTLLRQKSSNPNDTKCELCRYDVDLTPMDLQELKSESKDLINAIQQIKAVYDGDDKIFELLGQIVLGLEKLPKWYSNIYLAKRAEVEENNREYNYEGSNGTVYINSNNSSFGFDFYDKGKKKKKNKKKNKKKKNKWY